VIKKAVPDELVQAIRAVKNGEAYLSPAISQKVIDDYLRRADTAQAEDPYEELTSREKEILQLVAEGNSNKEMATKLHISVNTVTTHRRSLMSKLDLHNVADVTRFAVKKGLVAADGG
jgi:DNA-binding NarL/FixJ family response regulator